MAVVYTRSRSSTEERLHAIEDTVQYGPPSTYTPRNLAAYAAAGVTVDSLAVHRALRNERDLIRAQERTSL